jgi:transposase
MRLQSQCEKYNVKYLEIDEFKTTKQCSNCKEENIVGDKKIYECQNCNLKNR